MHRLIRPAFAAFVFGAPVALVAASALSVSQGDGWSAACYLMATGSMATLIPRERVLWRQGRGLGQLYGELRAAVAANVPSGETRLLRGCDDPFFYSVGRSPGRYGGEWVLIQRFDEQDLPEFGALRAGRLERGAMVCTVFVVHPWYPAVTREIDGAIVTSDGQDFQVQPAAQPEFGTGRVARRLNIRTGLGHADPAELHAVIYALSHADIVSGGPNPQPSR